MKKLFILLMLSIVMMLNACSEKSVERTDWYYIQLKGDYYDEFNRDFSEYIIKKHEYTKYYDIDVKVKRTNGEEFERKLNSKKYISAFEKGNMEVN